MNSCPKCGYPVVSSPHGDQWCSVWGTHTHDGAPSSHVEPISPERFQECVDELLPVWSGCQRGVPSKRALKRLGTAVS